MTINYEKDTNIDPDALDVEWLDQAKLMRMYSNHAAEMKKEMDNMKEKIEYEKAKIEMDIRSNPENYGLSKVTESAIQSTILLQKEYQELIVEYSEKRYEYDIAISAVRAIDQKKNALENLVRLFTASYFAGPAVPRNLYNEYMKKEEGRRNNAKIKIKRREKK